MSIRFIIVRIMRIWYWLTVFFAVMYLQFNRGSCFKLPWFYDALVMFGISLSLVGAHIIRTRLERTLHVPSFTETRERLESVIANGAPFYMFLRSFHSESTFANALPWMAQMPRFSGHSSERRLVMWIRNVPGFAFVNPETPMSHYGVLPVSEVTPDFPALFQRSVGAARMIVIDVQKVTHGVAYELQYLSESPRLRKKTILLCKPALCGPSLFKDAEFDQFDFAAVIPHDDGPSLLPTVSELRLLQSVRTFFPEAGKQLHFLLPIVGVIRRRPVVRLVLWATGCCFFGAIVGVFQAIVHQFLYQWGVLDIPPGYCPN